MNAYQLPLIPPAGTWICVKDGNPSGLALYKRHYSARKYADGRSPKLFCGPGEKIVLLTPEHDALFVWRKFIDASGQRGVNCAVFRNESPRLSSDLILDAMRLAWDRWPGERLYTYVNPRKICSRNAGYCFFMAGWQKCGTTKGGLRILDRYPPLPLSEMPSRRCETCATWATTCSIPGKITPFGPCDEAAQYNLAQGASHA
jgi:hypothetical protein